MNESFDTFNRILFGYMNIYLIHKVWSFLNILRTGCTALTEFGNQTKRTLLCMNNYGVTHLAVICHQVYWEGGTCHSGL